MPLQAYVSFMPFVRVYFGRWAKLLLPEGIYCPWKVAPRRCSRLDNGASSNVGDVRRAVAGAVGGDGVIRAQGATAVMKIKTAAA